MKTVRRTRNILMNDLLVGQLEKTTSGGLVFTYDSTWLKTPGARPISLALPLGEQPFTGDIVYNFFDNLLPDNTQIRARIQTKFHIKTNQPFDLLASIGKECVGAIQVVEDPIASSTKKISCHPIHDHEIATILQGYQNSPLGMTDIHDDFRISIAGAQEKSAFLYYMDQWNRPEGTTPTTHIFKLPIGFIQHQQMDLSDSCENEWLCAQIAAAFGLPVANCELHQFDKVKVLIVERFDRHLARDGSWIARLPQEDMCQALGYSPNLKYQSDGGPGIREIMRLLRGSANAEQDRDTFFAAQILFWILAAIDGHAKNFSLFIEPAGKYRLTPLYDIMSAYPLIAKHQLHENKIKMAMALNGKSNHYHWNMAQRRHFIETAKSADYSIDRAETILDEMLNKIDVVIEDVSARLPKDFPQSISQPIFEGMRTAKQRFKEK